MNDPEARFERELSELFERTAPSSSPRALIPDTERALADARRWPRWLALFKEPTMRSSSSLAVGSPMARVLAVMTATFLLVFSVTAVGIGANRLLLDLRTIVVDQSGNGDATTIERGLLLANDGDRILVRPGVYRESVIIHRDVALVGDGPVGEVVIEAPADAPLAPTTSAGGLDSRYAIRLVGSDGEVRDLTLRGEPSQLHIMGGRPSITGLSIDDVGTRFVDGKTHYSSGSISIGDGAAPVISFTRLRRGGPIRILDDSTPVIRSNQLIDGPVIVALDPGEMVVIRDNIIRGSLVDGISMFGSGHLVVEGNTIAASTDGIHVQVRQGFDIDIIDNTITGAHSGIFLNHPGRAVIQRNTIRGATSAGVFVGPGGQADISRNTLTDNRVAISVSDSDVLVANNDVSGGNNGIVLVRGGSQELLNNRISGANGVGITAGSGTSPITSGNRLCDNAANVSGLDEATFAAENEICSE